MIVLEWISIHDFIIPTTPHAGLFFGLAFSFTISLLMWAEIKDRRKAMITFGMTSLFVCVLVGILYFVGFYS